MTGSGDVPRAAASLLAALALTGCSQTVTGHAVKTTPSVLGADLFNPCTQLPDNVITQVGLDPATKRVVTDAPTGPVDARVCMWRPDGQQPYHVTVLSIVYTIDQMYENTEHEGFIDISIGERRALQSHLKRIERPGEDCYVSMQAAQGMFEISVGWYTLEPITADTCALAIQYATALEPHLPK